MTKQQLENILREFPGVDSNQVRVVGNGPFVAEIVVAGFDGIDEADRQERVYEFLRSRFPDDEMQNIEFIITNAPGDAAAE